VCSERVVDRDAIVAITHSSPVIDGIFSPLHFSSLLNISSHLE
jgi:hypothetical protein